MIALPVRRRYRVVLRGTHILVHHEDSDEPYRSFEAVRFVRARDAREAGAVAMAKVRNEWFASPFSLVNRTHAPVIQVGAVERVRNPFRRSRPNGGYTFFSEPGGRPEGGADGAPATAPPAGAAPTIP